MNYEDLIRETEDEGIKIYENNYIGKLKGLYVDNIITINSDIKDNKEKACTLAEELGHYHTTIGNILDQSKTENRKQERKARAWAYDRLIGIIGLVNAYKYGCRNTYEMAEYLNVSKQFLIDAITYYKQKYGLYYEIDNYVVYFEPLAVMEIWE